MDKLNSAKSPKTGRSSQYGNSATNVTIPKKQGKKSVNKVFIIIYTFVLLAIFAGPILFTDDDTILTSLAILITVGIPLLIVLVLFHIFFNWREKKKNNGL